MRADIQFSKFGKQRTKKEQILYITFYALAILCMSVAGVVFAYFTASAQLKSDTSFGRISVAFVDGSDNYLTDANFDTKFVNKINPGDIIDLSGVKIKNNGTHEAYVLVNVDISIEKTGATTLHYNKWYNIYGQEVNSNFSSNATAPTMLAKDATATTNIKWTVPGDVVSEEYAGATANITMTAYGSQTNLQRTSTYVNPELYASYYICKTAANATQNTEGKNLFNKNASPIRYTGSHSSEATDTGIKYINGSWGAWSYNFYSIGPVEDYTGKTIYLNADVKFNNVPSGNMGLGYIDVNNPATNTLKNYMNITTDGSYQQSMTIDANTYAGQHVSVVLYAYGSSETPPTAGSSVEYSNLMVSVGEHEYTPYVGTHTITSPGGEPLMKMVTSRNLLEIKNHTYTSAAFDYNISNQIISRTVKTAVSSTGLIPASEIPYVLGSDKLYPGTYIWSLTVVSGTIASGRTIELLTESGNTIIWNEDTPITLRETATIKSIKSALIGYVQGDSQSYKIQIERGTTATEWQAYSAVEDTLDYSTGTITRNIAKVEYTGTESWWEYTKNTSENKFCPADDISGIKLGFQMSICSHFENVNGAYDRTYSGAQGIYTNHTTATIIYFRAPKNRADIDTLDEWKAWLAEQYAKGTPVTVWYQLATSTTEYTTASKNIYNGIQDRHFTTGADDNNSSEATNIYVRSNPSLGYNQANIVNLEKDVFDVMWNNPTVLSYKMRRTVNDIVGSAHVSVCYYDSNSTLLGNKIDTTNKCPNDSSYHLMYITMPALSTLYYGQITWIRLQLSDYSSPLTSRDFSIKDIQIEIGESPTDYEPYEKAIYSYVNGKALYTTGDTFDTYNGSTKTITRNVNKIVFTGDENWDLPGSVISDYSSYRLISCFGAANVDFICSHFRSVKNDYYSNYKENVATSYPNSDQLIIVVSNDIANSYSQTDTEEWISWLVSQRVNGTPLMIYFAMATPTTETA